MIIGIDLGTTNSLIAVFRDGEVEIIPNALEQNLTPSVVGLDDSGQIIVGEAARQRMTTHPNLTTANFKRYMGSNREIKLGNKTFRPEDLSSLVLRSLKADAEAYLGESITEAVITVPAYFNDTQRKATRAAGELAGLTVERLLNEPTAAALAHGLHQKEENKFLVFDLGGGTFDISILELFDGVMEVHASSGDNFLGGEDFTELLCEHFLLQCAEQLGKAVDDLPETLIQRMGFHAEKIKRNLSQTGQVETELSLDGKELKLTIKEDEFEKLAAPLLDRITHPIQRALRDAKTRSKELDEVILVGGATRMPVIRKLVTKLFQRFPNVSINPDEVVVTGAAVQAGLKARHEALNEVVITDVCPYTLGVEVSVGDGPSHLQAGHYMPIIERNSYIPISREERVFTAHEQQKELDVRVFQGESPKVKDNIFLGSLRVAVPPNDKGEEAADIRFTYDINGLLEVEVTIVSSGEKSKAVIEENPGVLSKQEIQERFAKLAALKIHPRDQQENQAIISRAERLYQEFLGEKRSIIGESLVQFQHILAGQESKAIKTARDSFTKLMDEMENDPFL